MPRRTTIRLAVAAVALATVLATIAVLSARASADRSVNQRIEPGAPVSRSAIPFTPDDPAAGDAR